MNKEKYFEISKKLKLPLRCPILSICKRRFITEALLCGNKRLPPKGINMIEPVDDINYSKGLNPSFENFCPEFHLFPQMGRLSFADELAIKSAQYDIESKEFDIVEYSHYSECPEFCSYQYSLNSGQNNQNLEFLNKLTVAIALLLIQNFDKGISDDEISERVSNICRNIVLESIKNDSEIDYFSNL